MFWAVVSLLDNKVLSLEGQESLSSHLIDDHEWLVWLEADLWLWFISIDNVPLLILAVVSSPDNDVLVLSVSTS